MSERPRRVELTDPVTITVNGEQVTAQNGELLIDACERNGAYIPRFCYHPRMTPVGMCRMCLVEVDSGRGPALQPSCMIPVTPDMSVDTTSEKVAKAQDGVLEFLLANHPLDCPVCDKGGECPLQDQTMAYGPGESRWVEEKRHYEKPIPISELVFLDRERCILCDRCTRFASEVTDDPLIHFINRGSSTEVNTFPGEPFSSYFSGNTVQICPVGALTAKPYRFRARPWDLEEVESTCTTCSVGCRITVESSRNELLRHNGVDVDPVNWSWLCDRGRFDFEAVNSPDRLGEPLLRGEGGPLAPVRWSAALEAAARALRGAVDGGGRIAVLGGARLTNESAYAWAKLAKGVLGTDDVDAQLGDGLPADVFDLPGATIDDVCAAGGTVLWIGPDPKEELPVLFLRLKHAVVQDRVRLVELTPAATGLTRYAAASLHPRPGALGDVVRVLLSGDVPADGVAGVAAEDLRAAADLVRGAGADLRVVLGRANLAEAADVTMDAAAAVRSAVPGARFLPVLRRGNVRGAVEAGLAPGRLPGRGRVGTDAAAWSDVWPTVPAAEGLDATGILRAAADGDVDVLVLLGADPVADFPDADLARRALDGARTVIAVDQFLTDSSSRADVVLAAAGFAEVDGTTTNLEGRVSELRAKVTPPGTARADWMIAAELASRIGADLGVATGADELWAEVTAHAPVLDPAGPAALAGPDAADGVLVDLDGGDAAPVAAPEVPPVDAYSLRLVVQRSLYDGAVGTSHSPSLAVLAAAATVGLSTGDAERLGVADGDDVTVTTARGSLRAPARVDGRTARGTVVLRHLAGSPAATELLDVASVVTDARVEVG